MYISDEVMFIVVTGIVIGIIFLCCAVYNKGAKNGYEYGVNYADTKWSELADYYIPKVVDDTIKGKFTGLYGRYIAKNKR